MKSAIIFLSMFVFCYNTSAMRDVLPTDIYRTIFPQFIPNGWDPIKQKPIIAQFMRFENRKSCIHYEAAGGIDRFNTMFNEQIPYSIPFVNILVSDEDCPNLKPGIHIQTEKHYWQLDFGGIPLTILERDKVILETDSCVYHFKMLHNKNSQLASLKDSFRKKPYSPSPYGSDFDKNYYLKSALDHNIIEKDGDDYKHGANSFFAWQERENQKSRTLY